MIADLTGKIAIVTGGAQGIGAGICTVLDQQGAIVVVADKNEDAANSVYSRLLNKDSSHVNVDVTDDTSVNDMTKSVISTYGSIDILVNNAGIIGAEKWWTRENGNDDDWQTTFDVNVRGVVRCSDAVTPHMLERNYGKQVNIASIAARRGGSLPFYCVTKAAVVNWTQSKAAALASSGINVNAICPGLVWTPMTQRITDHRGNFNPGTLRSGYKDKDEFDALVKDWVPMKREQTPIDIGKVAAFLASDDAQNITGQAFNVDGGIYMN
ncbi:MAG: acetoin dehydrogenase [Dehalococcoidia bacterium]|nr:acetoin dehydrogenase [Dehalococcoidia bacterium]MQG15269.1 SDR family oxidoreductase [SAR202 cluster bacterium]|tara:strand:- start:991 stop:1794 length:804 start_codon:yes stop_codon:yes gene_type:complete